MSADNGYIIRRNKQGKYVLHQYMASATAYPPIDDCRSISFDTLEEAVLKYNSYINDGMIVEYGLTIDISEKETKVTLKTDQFARKPFYVDAIQVTAENMEAVAEWCHGDVMPRGEDGRKNKDARFVKVRVHRPITERHTRAFVGDWVLYSGTGFQVYADKSFKKNFQAVEVTQEGTDNTAAVHRSAETGEFITADEAKENPDTTVTESV